MTLITLTRRKFSLILGLTLVLWHQSFLFSSEGSKAIEFQTEEQTVYAFNNKGAALATRKNAAEEIINKYVKSSGYYLLEIIRNPKESKALQNFVSDLITKSKSPYLLELLEKQSLDIHTELYARKAFLYSLHKADLNRSMDAARTIASNHHDDESLRFESIGYLSKDATNLDNIETVRNIFLDKTESLTLRKAAFFMLESSVDNKMFSELLTDVLLDVQELQGFRVLAIEKLETAKDPMLQEHLVQIFFDSKETADMRQKALDKLSEKKESLIVLLPKFKNLYRRLKFGDFKESVRQLINTLEKMKKQQALKDPALAKTAKH